LANVDCLTKSFDIASKYFKLKLTDNLLSSLYLSLTYSLTQHLAAKRREVATLAIKVHFHVCVTRDDNTTVLSVVSFQEGGKCVCGE